MTPMYVTREQRLKLATELRALLAERDALKAKAQPVRKLREYKGIVYDPGCEKWRDGPVHFNRAVDAVACRHPLTDADHAAIYALKSDPYEPVETVEAVLAEVIGKVLDRESVSKASYATRFRAAVAAEGVRDA
jgi:hypothetical protein